MPTYTYIHTEESSECGFTNEFDVVESIKETAMTNCPDCNSQVKRIITSAPSFKMQGGTPKFHG